MGSYTYSTTAASNTSIDGLGNNGAVDPPSNIDNLIGRLAASQATLVRDLGGANTVAGTADAITVALADPTAATAYFDGMRLSFRAASDTTATAPTLNVDSIGTKTIVKTVQGAETALIAGDIQAGQTCEVVYRSAFASAAGAFELLNPSIESSIELGHATDTTLTRGAAGFLAVEGKRVPSPASQATGDILYRGATEWERLAAGTNGHYLTLSAGIPAWAAVSAGTTGVLDSISVFTSGGTWTRPSGVTRVLMFVTGAGGGGGAEAGTGSASSGGGAGGTAIKFLDVSSISTSTITVSSTGGAGQTGAGSGTSGGNSSWADGTNTITGSGGAGGARIATTGTVAGGAGGTATGGDLNITGGSGGRGAWSGTYGVPAMGGGSFWGGGGMNGYESTAAGNGIAYGAGGGASANGSGDGGTGAGGVVLVLNFK